MPVFYITFEMGIPAELVANDDAATTAPGAAITVPVLTNDTLGGDPVSLGDLDGPPTIETQPQNGTVTVNPDGTITYTPREGFTGTDTFEYRISTPEPAECIVMSASPYVRGRTDVTEWSYIPDWLLQQEDVTFSIEWEGGNSNTWRSNGDGTFDPNPDRPVPPYCTDDTPGTLTQGENSVCVLISVECPQ